MLQPVKAEELLPLARRRCCSTTKHQPHTVDVGSDCHQTKNYFCLQQPTWAAAGQQQRTGNQNHYECRNLDKQVNTLVEVGQDELLLVPFTQQCALKQRLGKNAAQPYTNKDQMQWQ